MRNPIDRNVRSDGPVTIVIFCDAPLVVPWTPSSPGLDPFPGATALLVPTNESSERSELVAAVARLAHPVLARREM
jgi:hypothetical protein